MARTLKKQEPIRNIFFRELSTAVKENPVAIDSSFDHSKAVKYLHQDGTPIWKHTPVDVWDFCDKFLREPLYPIQDGFAEAIVGNDPFIWSEIYDEGHAFWGKGSGKDATIAKLQTYVAYKLKCMHNPQKTLREEYGASIGDGAPIDLCNVSINAKQAEDVFFAYFKNAINRTINPETGINWFEERGVDLRDGYDIQNARVRFGGNVTAHSLNSETHTGEGLSPLFVTLDEFGAFKVEKAFLLLDALRDSVTSRFGRIGKVCVISYKYRENDAMHVLYEREKGYTRVYSSKATTWEVNLKRKRSDFNPAYSRNPEKARRTFECEGGAERGGFVTKKYMLDYMFDRERQNPIIGNIFSVSSDQLSSLNFYKWFYGNPNYFYCVHVDLAKGKLEEGLDGVGFSLVHPEMMIPKITKRFKRELSKEGTLVEFDKYEKKGVTIDLTLQIVAPKNGEIEFSTIRRFIVNTLMKKLSFNIVSVTFDGWQSYESIVAMNNEGIETANLSVDKKNDPYENWKEMMYQRLICGYYHPIASREAKELIIDDRGKVNHPTKSIVRQVQEGFEKGSKDVMDSIVGATHNAVQNVPVESLICFG